MLQEQRRIKKLHLNMDNQADAYRSRYKLEEAFRTASFPGLPSHAHVIVRRLELGKIDSDISPHRLAALISDKVASLSSTSIHILEPKQADTAVIWYSHELEARLSLLDDILAGRSVERWYWQSLFPFSHSLSRARLFERILSDSVQASPGGSGLLVVLEELMITYSLDRLIAFISPEFAKHLIAALGISIDVPETFHHTAVDISSTSLSLVRVENRWKNIIEEALRKYERSDARCALLLIAAAIQSQPAMLTYLQHRSASEINRVLDNLATYVSHNTERALSQRNSGVEGNEQNVSSSEVHPFPGQRGNKIKDSGSQTRLLENREKHPSSTPEQKPVLKKGEQAAVRRSTLTTLGEFSAFGGLGYLIPLFHRLGMTALLERNPALLAQPWIPQLIFAIGRRCGMAQDDANWWLHDELKEFDEVPIDHFIAPALWWKIVAEDGAHLFRYRTGKQGQFMVCDARHRFLLALGNRQDTDELLDRYAAIEKGRYVEEIRLRHLLVSLQLIGAWYLRTQAGMSYRSLLARDAKVQITKTHWDSFFDINKTDLRLRRIGLDCDPGWVAWLGKVVKFHFEQPGA